MTRDPKCVSRDATVADAVRIMSSEDCGVVPVTESDSDHSVVGIVTDRDIALKACQSDGKGPGESISSVMTSNVFCCEPGDDVSKVHNTMKQAGVHRVPVVEGKKIVGIVSLHDIATSENEQVLGNVADSILEQKPNN